MSCRYWGLNDPFCCVHRSRYSHCFQWVGQLPKIAPSRGGSRPHLIHVVFCPPRDCPGNGISIGSAVFVGHILVTHTQTEHVTCNVCSNARSVALYRRRPLLRCWRSHTRTSTFSAGLCEWRAGRPSGLLDAPTPVRPECGGTTYLPSANLRPYNWCTHQPSLASGSAKNTIQTGCSDV